ncbi:hypothetical protein [Gluconobacter kondonii]|uniref:hypothetical protein n=1 Tax=Gluconobacter kondonii TaxID=941463 RepID=UPI001B8D66CC|nr:hypothetical protein [Gluconobacter kondonii]MBS1079093.1 hypothetical protein [Gluconobacter kondonii]
MRRLSFLALSCALTIGVARSAPTSPSDHGPFDSGAYPPQAAGIVTHMDLSSALSSYVTQVSLTFTLSAYLTTSAAAKTYLPFTGGTITGNASINGEVTLTSATGTGNAYACLNASGQLYRSSTACQ